MRDDDLAVKSAHVWMKENNRLFVCKWTNKSIYGYFYFWCSSLHDAIEVAKESLLDWDTLYLSEKEPIE